MQWKSIKSQATITSFDFSSQVPTLLASWLFFFLHLSNLTLNMVAATSRHHYFPPFWLRQDLKFVHMHVSLVLWSIGLDQIHNLIIKIMVCYWCQIPCTARVVGFWISPAQDQSNNIQYYNVPQYLQTSLPSASISIRCALLYYHVIRTNILACAECLDFKAVLSCSS